MSGLTQGVHGATLLFLAAAGCRGRGRDERTAPSKNAGEANKFNVRSGVDYGFVSATTNPEVAMGYFGSGDFLLARSRRAYLVEEYFVAENKGVPVATAALFEFF